MVGLLSGQETALLEAVALWLREEMISCLKEDSPAPDLLYDGAQSNFEISCCALERVGLLASEDEYWRVRIVDNRQPISVDQYTRSNLDHLLDGLACHSFYVTELHRHYETVTPTGHALKTVCRAMADCGYMKPLSDAEFEWTDGFGPWLVRHGAWDLDEFEAAPEAEVGRALATIPDKAKEQLSGRLCRHQPDFVRCFFAQWIDAKWHKGEWRYAPSDDWDLNLAAGLYSQLHGH